MDTELLKTFLEVHRTRHFARAADNLCVTPSAVSARVRLLEEQLGVELFDRQRNNIGLTPAGERLLNHARSLLTGWERARQELALGEGQRGQLVIAAVPGLWDSLLAPWPVRLRRERPQLSLRLESMGTEALGAALRRGLVDLGLLFDPPATSGLNLRQVAELELGLYGSREGIEAAEALAEGYVWVDWGTAFSSRHAQWFPEAPPPAARVSTARLALALICGNGGAAYLARTMATADHLFPVAGAPTLTLPIFAVWAEGSSHEPAILDALTLLTAPYPA